MRDITNEVWYSKNEYLRKRKFFLPFNKHREDSSKSSSDAALITVPFSADDQKKKEKADDETNYEKMSR